MRTHKSVFLALCLSFTLFCPAQILEKIEDPIFENTEIEFGCVDKENNLWFTLFSSKENLFSVKVRARNISVGKYDGTNWTITETMAIPADEPKNLFLDKEKSVWCLGKKCLLKYEEGQWKKNIAFDYEIKEVFYQGQWLRDTLYTEMRSLFYVDDSNHFWLVSGNENTKGMLARYDGKDLFKYPNTLNPQKRDIEWTAVKQDSKGDIWFLNRAYIRSGNFGSVGKVDFYEYCGYKLVADSLIKFDGLTEDFADDGKELIIFNDEFNSAKSIAVLTQDKGFSIYSKSDGTLKYFEEINGIPLKKFDAYIGDGESNEYGFFYGKNHLCKYEGANFTTINLDSLLSAEDVEIGIEPLAADGIWFSTNEGILRYHDHNWYVFRKNELNANAYPKKPLNIDNWRVTKDSTILFGTNLGIFQWRSEKMEQLLSDPSQSFIVKCIDRLTDNTILYGTKMGIYRWNSGRLAPLLENPPQPFAIYGSDNTGTDTVLYRTNIGIYQWNSGKWIEITSKFGLQKSLPYKTYRINGYYFIVYTDGTCSVLKDQKASHFVFAREYNGQGKKIFKGFGESIITYSDSLLITLCKDPFNSEFSSIGVYSFLTGEWKYEKIPLSLMTFNSFIVKSPGSNHFLWIITLPGFSFLHFNGEKLNSLLPESLHLSGNNSDIFREDQYIWFSPMNNGLWRLNLNEPVTDLEINISLP
jgi:hypothetical protein